jgi:hypothetical protein
MQLGRTNERALGKSECTDYCHHRHDYFLFLFDFATYGLYAR